jgi:hypothetical protein
MITYPANPCLPAARLLSCQSGSGGIKLNYGACQEKDAKWNKRRRFCFDVSNLPQVIANRM